jgi:hypothetical protein
VEVKDMKERNIWSNLDLKIEDWADMFEGDPIFCTEEKSEEEKMEAIVQMNSDYLDDERMNLDVTTDGRILVIADLGLWNGRHSGYRILKDYNINEILSDSDCEYMKWYSDGRDIRFTGHHHDGTNHYLYREIREDKDIDVLLQKIYEGKAERKDITKYTKSILPYVAKVYGW